MCLAIWPAWPTLWPDPLGSQPDHHGRLPWPPAWPPARPWPAVWPTSLVLVPDHHGQHYDRLPGHLPGLASRMVGSPKCYGFLVLWSAGVFFPTLPNYPTRISPPLEVTQASPPPLPSTFSHPHYHPLPKSETPHSDLSFHPSDFILWCGELEILRPLGVLEEDPLKTTRDGIRLGYSCVSSHIT